MDPNNPWSWPVDEFLAWVLEPDVNMPAWPATLPTGLKHHDYSNIDECKTVFPSWNTIPRREVVRTGSTVAVIDISECGVVWVVNHWNYPAAAKAQKGFRTVYRQEREWALERFDQLPEDMKEGAALP